MSASFRRQFEVLRESLKLDRQQARDRIARDHPAFLPAALEITETPPNPAGRLLLWLIIGFVLIAILWACLGQVDVVATAQGKLAPRGRVKIVQAADLGVVRALHVSEGQPVTAGQPLIELDPTVGAAEVEQARQALKSAEVDVARATALAGYVEKGTATFVAPAGMAPEDKALQQALVNARARQYSATVGGLRSSSRQRESDEQMIVAEITKLETQLPLAEDQLASLESLEARGYAPRLRVDEVRERVVGLRQDLAIRREELRRAGAGRQGAVEEIERSRGEFAREIYDALTEARANQALRAEELKKAEERVRLTVLRAPETGVVQQVQTTTVGGVVEAAAPLMVLVPRDSDLVLDARVLNRDIGFLQEGQSVEVKLEAYPFTRYGVAHGVLEHIGRDAVEDEREGLIFPVRVRLSQPWISVGGRRTMLAPGMAATAEIKTGRRRIIEYLLSPLLRRVNEAGREQ